MVNMVNNKTNRGVNNDAVHFYFLSTRIGPPVSDSIKRIAVLSSIPFVFRESGIIIWVNDGEFALGQRNSSKGEAIAKAPVQKYEENNRPFNPGWNFYGDFRNFHHPNPTIKIVGNLEI